MDFEKERQTRDTLNFEHYRVKAFEMAHLQDAGVVFGGFGHPVGLFEGGGDRLFDQNVDTRIEQRAGDLGVGFGRDSDDGGLNLTDDFVEIRSGARSEFLSDGLGASRIGIDYEFEGGAGIL
jgi:hypothetical protein